MTDQRDPLLESAFIAAEEDTTDEAFTLQVMSGVNVMERWDLLGRLGVCLVLAACALLLAPPLQGGVAELNQFLQLPLVEAENWPAGVLSPLNSMASVAAAAALGVALSIRMLLMWLFS